MFHLRSQVFLANLLDKYSGHILHSVTTSFEQDLEILRSAAVAAGIMAMGYFRREIKTWTKDNDSPVTEADILVDEFLGSSLLAARPDYGWLSEETADNLDRLERTRTFIVDPIDGTRGFIRGDDRWTICLAVVEDGVPVAGVVYAPARNELYEAARGSEPRLNGELLKPVVHSRTAPIFPASAPVHKQLVDNGFEYVHGPAIPSLAYRLIQVATGDLDGTGVRRGAQDWDIAAAAAILTACDLELEDICEGTPVYNKKEVSHGALMVVRDPAHRPAVHKALKNVYGCPNQ